VGQRARLVPYTKVPTSSAWIGRPRAAGTDSHMTSPEARRTEVMEHGASAESDVTVLFVTNKAFRIDYVDEPSR
jgi:hypothetical protein